MEIKYCLRCEREWCFRGIGRPTCCGKCKSPYWDKERVNAKVDSEVDSQDLESKDKRAAVPGVRPGNNKQLPASRVGIDVRSYPKASSLLRPSHDPKTCKVHRCGLCAVAKEK